MDTNPGCSCFRVAGGTAVVSLITTTVVMSGNVAIFLNPPSFILVAGVTACLLLWSFERHALQFAVASLMLLLGKRREPNLHYATIARYGARYALGAAAIGTLIGFVQMLATLDDPSKIGGGMAISLLSLLYGLLLSEVVFMPLHAAWSDSAHSESNAVPSRFELVIAAVVACSLLVIFLVLLLSFGL